MIRSELLTALHRDNPELPHHAVERIVDIFFDAIAAQLERGGRIELRGFGVMSTRPRDARIGRNPRNGARVDVPPRRAIHFKPGKPLWLRINAGGSDER